jgi:hypothetical protein
MIDAPLLFTKENALRPPVPPIDHICPDLTTFDLLWAVDSHLPAGKNEAALQDERNLLGGESL